MFTRSFHGDLDALLAATEPVCLVRFGDGEIALVDGIAHQSADAWRTQGPSWIRGDVIRSLRNDAPGWCVGLPPPCCLRTGVRIHPAIRIPKERVTFSTLFLHANLRSFPRVLTRFADALTVGSWFGDIRVPADGVTTPWDVDACVAEIISAKRDVLLAAGPCSNVIALRYWDRVPEADKHFVLDVGSALDVANGRNTRHFHTAMTDHFCAWGLPTSLANPRAALQRVVAKPVRRQSPAEMATVHRPEREPIPRAAPKLEPRVRPAKAILAPMPTAETTTMITPSETPRVAESVTRPSRPARSAKPAKLLAAPARASAPAQRRASAVRVRKAPVLRPSPKAEATIAPARETRPKPKTVLTRERSSPSKSESTVAATRETRPKPKAVLVREPSTSKASVRQPLEMKSRPRAVMLEKPAVDRGAMPAPTRLQSRTNDPPIDPTTVTGEAIAVVVTKRPWLAVYVGRMLAWQSLRPSGIVVCSACADYDTTPIKNALPDVPVVFVRGGEAASLGELRNTAMDAASLLSGTAILCTIDDDDCYGTHYLAGIVDAWKRHPVALVVGLGSFETRTVDAPPSEAMTQRHRSRVGMRAPVGGATISIPAKVWRERADLRYPLVGIGEDIELLKIAQHHNRVAAAYFGDFVALRYTDPAHAHTSHNQGLGTP